MGVLRKMVFIRKAVSHEIEKILNYSPIVMKESTMGFIEGRKGLTLQMMSQILVDGGYYLVYVDNQVIKGWIGIGRSYNFYTEKMQGIILELYVLPQYRRKGIAEKLLKDASDRLRKTGLKKIQLNVYSGNSAKHLYEKFGFYDISTMMEKDLLVDFSN